MAQELAAEAFGSDTVYFLVGGSTVGNLAAILAVLQPDDLVLVVRNAHQSVWHALALAGARKVVLATDLIVTGPCAALDGSLSATTLKQAIKAYPQAVAVILTSPTYHGFVSDVAEIVRQAHDAGMVVIVDEAHGAHLPFHCDLPTSAIAAKADLVIQSPHKMLAALTQTGLLHISGDRVERRRVQHRLRMIQTSSPSYLLLASIDAVRAQMAMEGAGLLERAMAALRVAAERVAKACPGLLVSGQAGCVKDPFKWTLFAQSVGMTGFATADLLREQYGIYVELCDEAHVLLSFSYANENHDIARVGEVLSNLHATENPSPRTLSGCEGMFAQVAVSAVLPTNATLDRLPFRTGDLQTATGHILLDAITVYPPGIPWVLPGEVLHEGQCDRLLQLIQRGVRVDGIDEYGRVRFAIPSRVGEEE